MQLPDPESEYFFHEYWKSSVRAWHETVNGRLKNYKALTCHFRHAITKHSFVFQAVAVMVQLALKHEHPLFNLE